MQKEAQTRCETWFQFHTSGHLWYRDSGMHSCSDKRKLVRSSAAQHMFQLQPLKTQHHAAVWPQGSGWGGRERCLFFSFLGFAGLGVRAVRDTETKEKEWVSRASSSPGRKEEFPLASDCLTCKNVAFVAGLCSIFFGRLAVTSCLRLLCRFTFLPSNPVSLDSARLQPLQRNSADWFLGYGPHCPVVFF